MAYRTIIVLAMVVAMCWAAPAQMVPPGHFGGNSNLLNTGSISGSVRVGEDNQPARDVRIEVRNVYTGEILASTYTSPSGNFEVSNLPNGIYEVHATSGVSEAFDRVELRGGLTTTSLHLSQAGSDAGNSGSATVSVAQFKVPNKARDAYRKAEKAVAKQKLDEATEYVEKALEICPEYADALTLRAILRLDKKQVEEALVDLDKAVHVDPNYGLAYIVLGATYNMTQKFDLAVRSLERGVALHPSSWQAYFEMGKAFLGKGDVPAALRNLNRAEQMAPDAYAPIHLVKAHAYLALKSYPEAMTELEMYLQREPDGKGSLQARQELEQVRAFAAAAPRK